MQPLDGVRVIEVGSFITAPYASMLLGELGADVIKVERPHTGDPFRSFKGGLYSPHFQAHNRHKRSIALDLAEQQDRDALERLLASADVLVLNSRPGALVKMGLDFDSVHARHPRLVHCAITGFGPDGPYAERPAFDNVGQALSGWMSRFRTSNDPRVVGPAVSDSVTAIYTALAIVSALHARQRDGRGRRVDVSMLECTMALGLEPLSQYLATGAPVPVFQRAAMSQAYTVVCQDDKRIGLHLSSPDKFWTNLCNCIGKPDWALAFPRRQDRIVAYERIAAELNAVFSTRTRSDWLQSLAKFDVPHAPELTLADLQDDPQVRHLQMFEHTTHPRQGKATALRRPVRIDSERNPNLRAPPELGEHTGELLRELGYSESQIGSMNAPGRSAA